MNPVLKDHLLQVLFVFVSTFFVTAGVMLKAASSIDELAAILAGALVAAGAAVLKELAARFAPVSLGGRRGATLFGYRK